MNIQTRLKRLEQSSAGRIAQAEASGDFSELTDDELRNYCQGNDLGKRLALATDEDLEAIARGDVAAVKDGELRKLIESQ